MYMNKLQHIMYLSQSHIFQWQKAQTVKIYMLEFISLYA